MKIVVLDGYCLNPGDLSWDRLQQFGKLQVYERTTTQETGARLTGAGIALTNKTRLDAETLKKLPTLRYIGVLATGYDVVDVSAARAQDIIVTNIPTYGTASVAQYVFALLLELCHHVGLHADAVRAGEWTRSPDWCFTKSPLMELTGKTMGVIGFGRIGRHTAQIANAFGMRVIAADAFQVRPPDYEGFRWASVEELLKESDVVSLHTPLTSQTKQLINARSLSLMKPSALLINTARGPLVDASALVNALNSGKLGGAALDVLPTEPPDAGDVLLSARNCIVTPHVAWATFEARSRLMEAAIENVAAFLAGQPRNVVN